MQVAIIPQSQPRTPQTKRQPTHLEELCRDIQVLTLDISYKAHVGHIGSALSLVDLLTVLYFHTLHVTRRTHSSPQRDRCILSKGHAAAALYSVLYKRGILTKKQLSIFAMDEGGLCEHPEIKDPGVDMTTGSLGHGLAFGVGIALGLKKNNGAGRIFVLMSDGECGEGSVWEAAILASHLGLDNLTVILENNGWQCFGKVVEITGLPPLAPKWQSFGWAVREIDGHNIREIQETFDALPFERGKPSVVIAHTISGKGVRIFEDTLDAHYKILSEEEYRSARRELAES